MSSQAIWVKLYMEAQSQTSEMPVFLIGLLNDETQTGYVLQAVVQENDDFEYEVIERMNIISKTYVWRCEVLGDILPEEYQPRQDNDYEGGLG